jgi:hypothetical protein
MWCFILPTSRPACRFMSSGTCQSLHSKSVPRNTDTLSCNSIWIVLKISIYDVVQYMDVIAWIGKLTNAISNTKFSILTDLIQQSSSSSTSPWSSKPIISSLSDVFLPSGYPQSVSDDYLPWVQTGACWNAWTSLVHKNTNINARYQIFVSI